MYIWSGPHSEKIKKDFQAIFNENSLKIEIKCNLKIVDYLGCHIKPNRWNPQTILETQ